MKKLLAYIVLAAAVIGGGCIGTLSEELSPGRVDKKVVAFNEEAGTGAAADYKGLLWPRLASIKRLRTDFEAAVVVTNQELKHLVEQKRLQAKILRGVVTNDYNVAAAREEFLFNPTTGALAVGLSLLGVGAGGYLGLMRKRPQDITPVEMETALGEVKGEVTNKDRQIIQLVASMKNVIQAQPEANREAIVKTLKDGQLPETRTAVKKVLAQL